MDGSGNRSSIVYCWGSFLGDSRADTISVTACIAANSVARLYEFPGKHVRDMATGLLGSIAVFDDGSVCEVEGDTLAGPGSHLSRSLRQHRVQQIACGFAHVLFATDRGVFSAGFNRFGQLGHSYGSTESSVHEVPLRAVDSFANRRVLRVCAGGNHSMLIDVDGNAFTFGRNSRYGSLGIGSAEESCYAVPQRLRLQELALPHGNSLELVDGACGSEHSLLLSRDGSVFSFGLGLFGALGHGDNLPQLVPTLVTSLQGLCIVRVFAGLSFSAVLSDSADIYTFGSLGSDSGIANTVYPHLFDLEVSAIDDKTEASPCEDVTVNRLACASTFFVATTQAEIQQVSALHGHDPSCEEKAFACGRLPRSIQWRGETEPALNVDDSKRSLRQSSVRQHLRLPMSSMTKPEAFPSKQDVQFDGIGCSPFSELVLAWRNNCSLFSSEGKHNQ